MKYGLSEKQLAEIVERIGTYAEVETAVLFGSRTIDTFKEASDVDIALKGEHVTASLAAKLKYDFEEESYLPFFFDFVAYPTITNEALRRHIDDKGIVIFRREWRECKLGDAPLEILDGDRGKNYPSQDEFKTSGHCLFLSTKNVRVDGFDFSDCQYISKERDELLRKGKLKRNDIVLTTRGTVGNIGFFDDSVQFENIRINSGMVIIRPNEAELLPSFNYYVFQKLQNDFHTFISGSAQPQLPIRDLKEIEILLPALPEQKAIAAVLSSLDDKIDLLHRQNITLEAMAETLFRQWFVVDAREDWEEVSITKLFEVRDGTHDSPKQNTVGKPLITSKHIVGNRQDFESAYLISDEDFEKINQRSKVDKNDILISMIGTIGLIYLEQANKVDYAIKNVGLFKTSQNPEWVVYTYFWLKSHLGRQFLDEHISGSTQEYVSLGSFRSITFKKPPKDKLREFNELAEGYLNKIKINSLQTQTLATLRDTLLPKLMSGEVRVNKSA